VEALLARNSGLGIGKGTMARLQIFNRHRIRKLNLSTRGGHTQLTQMKNLPWTPHAVLVLVLAVDVH